MIRYSAVLSVFLGVLFFQASALAQTPPVTGPLATQPTPLTILGVSVEGAEAEFTRSFVLQASDLTPGETITIPGDPAIADAIRSIYRLGMFSDVKIVEERRVDDGLYLAIIVKEEPKLSDYSFSGVKKSHRNDLEKEAPLLRNTAVKPSTIDNTIRVIKDFYEEKGHPLADVQVTRTVDEEANTVALDFAIDRGPKVRVGDVEIVGNEQLSDGKIVGKMETKPKGGWKFWRRGKFNESEYRTDIQTILDYYNEKGFYDARIVADTVALETEGDKPRLAIKIEVEEGDLYYIRDVEWEGNTVYREEALDEALGLEKGSRYNGARLEENLFGNRASTDVASLYLNRGYMRFGVDPTIRVVGEDSLDITMEIQEGEVFTFGDIKISGNTKTKEHVIRRELLTMPGNTFSREAIQESIRRLVQLNYFDQASFANGPDIDVNDAEKEVDLEYTLEEAGSDQLELSGTWGQFGLVLQLGFTFNNFSAQNLFKKGAWDPIPAGDGQKLSLGVQTNGRYYQQYSMSFSEPWYGGKPRLVGFSLAHSRIGRNPLSTITSGGLVTSSARVFLDRQIKWPDDHFRMSTTLGYQYFNNDNWISTLQQGVSHEITLKQTLSRNSTNHPIFPSSGSRFVLSGEIAPPLGELVQYHKWRFQTSWNLPITNKLAFGISTDYGFLGSLTGERVEFERFVVGGSPFETSGVNSFFGKDIIYTRGYPLAVIGPRSDSDPIGGLILNKYQTELRWMAIQSPQLQAAPYLFFDAANTWDKFGTYSPTSLFRSTGMGVRLFLPILGMVELAYGYNLDEYSPLDRTSGAKNWNFQFTLGQGFGQ